MVQISARLVIDLRDPPSPCVCFCHQTFSFRLIAGTSERHRGRESKNNSSSSSQVFWIFAFISLFPTASWLPPETVSFYLGSPHRYGVMTLEQLGPDHCSLQQQSKLFPSKLWIHTVTLQSTCTIFTHWRSTWNTGSHIIEMLGYCFHWSSPLTQSTHLSLIAHTTCGWCQDSVCSWLLFFILLTN